MVLAYCFRHLMQATKITQGGTSYTHTRVSARPTGKAFTSLLRESGTVQRVPANQVSVWTYQKVNGQYTWFSLAPTATTTPGAWKVFMSSPRNPGRRSSRSDPALPVKFPCLPADNHGAPATKRATNLTKTLHGRRTHRHGR